MGIQKRRVDTSVPWRNRPASGSLGGRVWKAADDFYKKKQRMPRASDIESEYLREGDNKRTAENLLSRWRSEMRALEEVRADSESASSRPSGSWLRTTPEGDAIIPSYFLNAIGVPPDGGVLAQVVDGEIRLVPLQLVTERLRSLVRSFDTGEGSVVDELIRERRAEAERE